MQLHHPLENTSLTPYGFVFPSRKARLEYEPKKKAMWVGEERIIAHLWDQWNKTAGGRKPAVQTIIHEILPELMPKDKITGGDFTHDGLPYLTRDILLLSSTIQWFGTNVGRCFFETKIENSYHSQKISTLHSNSF